VELTIGKRIASNLMDLLIRVLLIVHIGIMFFNWILLSL